LVNPSEKSFEWGSQKPRGILFGPPTPHETCPNPTPGNLPEWFFTGLGRTWFVKNSTVTNSLR